jgi:hypothetical protein
MPVRTWEVAKTKIFVVAAASLAAHVYVSKQR